MQKNKNSKGKVNFFTIKVNPVVFFILDFILTAGALLLLDLLWYRVIKNEELQFGIFGNIILPLILSIVGTMTMVNNEKRGK